MGVLRWGGRGRGRCVEGGEVGVQQGDLGVGVAGGEEGEGGGYCGKN